MSPRKYAVLLVPAVAAGCAAGPTSQAIPETLAAVAAEPAIVGAGDALEDGAAVDPTVVELRASDPDPKVGEVLCREELLPASNVIKTRCMTAADWKRHQRIQELQAQDFLRRLRGGL